MRATIKTSFGRGLETGADQEVASGEVSVAEGGDQRPCPVAEAYRPEDLACQDDVLVGVDVLLVPGHTLVVERGSHRVQLGLVGDPGQAQSLAGVGIPAGDDLQDQVQGPYRAVHADLVGHVRRVVVVGVLDVADQLG